MKRVWGISVNFLALALTALLSACVQPPSPNTGPSVIPKNELSLVSHMSAGRTFIAQGRFDLAEIEFRKALTIAPQQGSLYSDLGYVVSAQQRYNEAISFFEITLRFSPGDIAALTNLAATYFKMGDYEKSIASYDTLLAKHSLKAITEFGVPSRYELTNAELVDIYRNLSIVHNLLGNYGEAVCWSNSAVIADPANSQFLQHARLLLSMERSADAKSFMERVIAEKKQQIAPELMLDFGAVSLELGAMDVASQALSQLELFPGVSISDELDAQLLLAVLAERRGDDSLPILAAATEEDASLCDSGFSDRRRYWPERIVEDTDSLIRTYCNESRKSFFSASKLFAR